MKGQKVGVIVFLFKYTLMNIPVLIYSKQCPQRPHKLSSLKSLIIETPLKYENLLIHDSNAKTRRKINV